MVRGSLGPGVRLGGDGADAGDGADDDEKRGLVIGPRDGRQARLQRNCRVDGTGCLATRMHIGMASGWKYVAGGCCGGLAAGWWVGGGRKEG